jgi:hypothetical protein
MTKSNTKLYKVGQNPTGWAEPVDWAKSAQV